MFALPATILNRFRKHPITPRKMYRSPSVVRSKTAEYDVTLMKAQAVCHAKLYRKGRVVYLLNNAEPTDRVLSIRAEYCDPNYVEHDHIVNYRALVLDTISKQSRFVDLVPGQMLRVI